MYWSWKIGIAEAGRDKVSGTKIRVCPLSRHSSRARRPFDYGATPVPRRLQPKKKGK